MNHSLRGNMGYYNQQQQQPQPGASSLPYSVRSEASTLAGNGSAGGVAAGGAGGQPVNFIEQPYGGGQPQLPADPNDSMLRRLGNQRFGQGVGNLTGVIDALGTTVQYSRMYSGGQ